MMHKIRNDEKIPHSAFRRVLQFFQGGVAHGLQARGRTHTGFAFEYHAFGAEKQYGRKAFHFIQTADVFPRWAIVQHPKAHKIGIEKIVDDGQRKHFFVHHFAWCAPIGIEIDKHRFVQALGFFEHRHEAVAV